LKKIEKLLNIIFDTLEYNYKINKEYSKEITTIFSEDSLIMGLKFLDIPFNNLINEIDKFFDIYIDFEKYPYAGKNLDYIVFEKNIFDDSKQNIKETNFDICFDENQYIINTKQDAVYFLMDAIIPSYILDTLEKNNKINRDELIQKINIFLFKSLLNFHRDTSIFIDNFKKQIGKFISFDNDDKLFYFESLDFVLCLKLLDLNDKIPEDALYNLIYKYNYGNNFPSDLKLPSSIKEYENNTYIINNVDDYIKWFIYDFK
jgi:hypothetical protein